MRPFSLLVCVLLTACSTQHVYDTLQHKNCMERRGIIYCEDSVDYKTYQKQREELLKKEQPKPVPEKTIPLPGPRAEQSQP
ncbi:MAG: hypothetical protein H7A09_03325 [Oceanospirillaceae bacterium]|nr:hypothetical protein [Oceanospirillaceae bacterium]MCP5335647.1 hypothetical protein [Oceanospirillaceae bacterium]